jgi:stress-induced morphogen
MDFDELKTFIQSHLKDAEVEITDLTGTQDHLGLTITSDAFKGKRLIQQHQMVMDILRDRLKQDIHAVQIKTQTKSE